MSMEKLAFGWYLCKISWLALIGYVAGALVYLAEFSLIEYLIGAPKRLLLF